ncbi:hypothetical protein BH23GEM3_BH23GEM3_06090 [soil metagenome]|jgi:hypothetical protein|nr:hypothetical protein [Gemmatimonadota bacterium]
MIEPPWIAQNLLPAKTSSADEQWDDSLDLLARAVADDLDRSGLLADGAADAVRYHFRGYARRLLLPVLEDRRGELRASGEALYGLEQENRRLQAAHEGVREARGHEVRSAALAASLITALILAAGALLLG